VPLTIPNPTLARARSWTRWAPCRTGPGGRVARAGRGRGPDQLLALPHAPLHHVPHGAPRPGCRPRVLSSSQCWSPPGWAWPTSGASARAATSCFCMERPGRGAGHEADLSEGSQRMYLGPRGRGCCAAAEQGVSGDAKCMVRSLHVHMVPYSCASSCRNTQVERHKHG